ncbi:MAG: DNA-directed RNA polymerase subunit G [Desulfurococcaceae archaeon]|nr:DNA-directed RNA polymerase subunit G [Desulfurococcaceae archaeon]
MVDLTAVQSPSYLELRGRVTEVSKSLIPRIVIYSVDCGDVKVRFDALSELLKLNTGDEVAITVSKEKPNYSKGVDYVAWGYVVSLRSSDRVGKVIISLWGYIVILESANTEVLKLFNYMDKVYFKVSKLST